MTGRCPNRGEARFERRWPRPYGLLMATDEGIQHASAVDGVRQIQERLAAASLNPAEGLLWDIFLIVRRIEDRLDKMELH